MRRDFVPDLVKDAEKRSAYWLGVAGRLRPGVTLAQATAAVNVVDTRINQSIARTNAARR